MKILAVVSAIDLALKQAVPSWWQLFKGLYELDAELVVTPYVGRSVESLWWKSYKNPCEFESRIANSIVSFRKNTIAHSLSARTTYNSGTNFQERSVKFLAGVLTMPRWKKHLTNILEKEKDVESVIFFNIPPNQIEGIPRFIKQKFGVSTVSYDMDAPDSLPGFSSGRLASNWYVGADLTEYDAFITNSEGAIPILKDMGANNAYVIHFGIDPSIYHPVKVNKNIDVFFYGQGPQFRQDWINSMISEPSVNQPGMTFLVGGGPFKIDLGKSIRQTDIPMSSLRKYCCGSKINLNITRKHHAEIYCSSTARIFELASLGCCIVSNPVNGLEKWFDLKDEVIMIEDGQEAAKTYEWLLQENDIRDKMGEKARQRVLRDHTHTHMARKLIDILESIRNE